MGSPLPNGDPYEVLRQRALLAYSDACALPLLTPECPFYRVNDTGEARCGEECKTLLEPGDRPTDWYNVSGLEFLGRAVPLRAVAGADDFDAQQRYVQDAGLPMHERSTSSLFLSLAGIIDVRLVTDPTTDRGLPEQVADTCKELAHRGLPVNRLLSSGLSLQAAVSVLKAVQRLGHETPAVPLLSSPEALAWRDSLTRELDLEQARPTARSQISSTDRLHIREELEFERLSSATSSSNADLVARVLSSTLLDTMMDWFSRLFVDAPARAFTCECPSDDLHRSSTRDPSDATARWVWERFTRTDLSSWSQDSLLKEWHWGARHSPEGFPERILRERTINPVELADAHFRAADSLRIHTRPRGFSPDQYVEAAGSYLQQGKFKEAQAIYGALVRLRPLDKTSWNNLGFCLMPTHLDRAISVFHSSVRLGSGANDITIINLYVAYLAATKLTQADAIAGLLRSACESIASQTAFDQLWLWSIDADGHLSLRSWETSELDQYLSLLARVRELHAQG